jgi:hypothetical protein
MKISAESKHGWTRAAQLGAVVFACAALFVGTTAAGASAQPKSHGSVPRGIQNQLNQLEYNQKIDAAKLAITEKQSQYGLLFNGDGPHGPDRVKWGKQIFTGEGAFLAYDANLNLIPAQSFAHFKDEIADAVATQPATWPNTASANGSMHYMFAPVFDKITPTTATTDTPSMSVSGVKGTAAVNSVTIRVYHDTWKLTKAGWRKTASTWYRLD